MPDLDLIKQEEQGVRDRRGRSTRGRSGNPAGLPHGSSPWAEGPRDDVIWSEGARIVNLSTKTGSFAPDLL